MAFALDSEDLRITPSQSESVMQKSESIGRRFYQVDVQDLGLYLRRRHPMKCAENVGAAIGVQAATVRKWLSGEAAPGFAHTLRLIKAYGPEILAVMLGTAPDWLDDAVRAQRHAELAARREALTREMDDLRCGRS